MTEKDLKDRLVQCLRSRIPRAVVLRHEDKNTAGIPDISVTYGGHTVWLEVKYATPHVLGRGLQNFTCTRLATQGICWYLVYKEYKGRRSTAFIRPKDVVDSSIIDTPDECMAAGFDHEFAVRFIRRLCGDYDEQEHIPRDTRDTPTKESSTAGDDET